MSHTEQQRLDAERTAQEYILPSPEEWAESIRSRLSAKELGPLELATQALLHYPVDGTLLVLAAYAGIVEEKPDAALRYLKRFTNHFYPDEGIHAGRAIALAQLGRWPNAKALVERYRLATLPSWVVFRSTGLDTRAGGKWLRLIERWQPPTAESKKRPDASGTRRAPKRSGRNVERAPKAPATEIPALAPLPRFPPRIGMNFSLPSPAQYAILDEQAPGALDDFLLRHDFSRLALLRGFDELLCVPHLQNVDHYWYQTETVRKVLKQFRGRVLLADEVGLGKTIEAGMVLKEYILRGMATRVLILTPPSLVGQWQEEMATKFRLDFVTSNDPLLRRDPDTFWSGKRIIASIATARLSPHFERVTRDSFDLVVVDESHHLKNRTSKNWKLVDALKKRFLLLLSATPVQNTLVELYNVLTLLKPGLFRTEREFRGLYMKPRHPRIPVNRERLRDLMRDVMIRNTRALVDVRLPPRQALTLRVDPSEEEQSCYHELSRLVRELRSQGGHRHGLALHHLLEAAGSSAAAVSASLGRFISKGASPEWHRLQARYAALRAPAKVRALLELLERNPAEKKMVFVRFTDTLSMLDRELRGRGVPFARFDGRMNGPAKDAAIEEFRGDLSVLLCTESGGEGRNVQFCNTMVNFDLPWNPQKIEQRIGRVHRIGQQREVFVFNLAARGTVEERILAILDEKINMFELVVGEVQSVLGELEEESGFADLVFSAWVQETESHREEAFDELGRKLLQAQERYEQVKALDEDLFGEEFEVV